MGGMFLTIVPSGIVQATNLGRWFFIIMINDLIVQNTFLCKHVDDTTCQRFIFKGNQCNANRLQ